MENNPQSGDIELLMWDVVGRDEDNNLWYVIRALAENSLDSNVVALKDGFQIEISTHDPTGYTTDSNKHNVMLKSVSFNDSDEKLKINLIFKLI